MNTKEKEMNMKDLKQGLTLGIAFASMVALFPNTAEAEEQVKDSELCKKSIAYSVEYMPNENGGTLHQARWDILMSKKTDDIQKMVAFTMFEAGQRIGYSFDSETMGGEEWWKSTIGKMNSTCEELLGNLRSAWTVRNGTSIESANPEEVW